MLQFLKSTKRCILTLFFSVILVPFLLVSCASQPQPQPHSEALIENSAVQETSIEGLWKQYMLVNEDFFYGGTFVVTKTDGIYEMEYYDEDVDRNIKRNNSIITVTHSRGLFDVTFSEKTWEFKSEWSGGRVGEFKLNEVYPDLFEGYAYENGIRKTFNRWERVK